MPFRRREPLGFSEKIRDLFWPRTGFSRSLRYMKLRLLRLSASPHSIAAGVAIGVGVAWMPFLGVHIIIAMALGFLMRVNLVAAALGTTFANPLTFPFIWASTWELGHVILGRKTSESAAHVDFVALFSHLEFRQIWTPVLEPMTIGAVPPAIISAVIAYIAVYWLINGFQRRKMENLAHRAANKNASLEMLK